MPYSSYSNQLNAVNRGKAILATQLWKNLPSSQKPNYTLLSTPVGERIEGTPFHLLGIGGFASVFGAKNSEGKDVAVRMVYSTTNPRDIERSHIPKETLAIDRMDQKLEFLPATSPEDKRKKYSVKYISRPKIIVDQELSHDDLKTSDYLLTIMESPLIINGDLSKLEETSEDSGLLNHTLLKKLAKGILKSLHTLHSNNLIHLDIKPENILVPTANIVLPNGARQQKRWFSLSDFGLMTFDKLGKIEDMYARVDKVAGTPVYASPEVMAASEQCNELGGLSKLKKCIETISNIIKLIHDRTQNPTALTIGYYKDDRNKSGLSPELQKKFETAKKYMAFLDRVCPLLDKIGPPSDIYSFGVTLLEIATKHILGRYNGRHIKAPDPAIKIKNELKLASGKTALDSEDDLFFQFVGKLTTKEPKKRLTAQQALHHVYLRKM